uniref:Uncharacterized protein n=1 Tax=Quercus lobata TaxID=97700 RepID=A0A7N2KKL0_QUELO
MVKQFKYFVVSLSFILGLNKSVWCSSFSILSLELTTFTLLLLLKMDGMGSDELISSVPNFARGLDILLVDHETASLMYLASLLEQYTFKGKNAQA